MNLYFEKDSSKKNVFEEITNYIKKQNLKITSQDSSRPWGGFFVIDETDAEKFIDIYFPQLTKKELSITEKISPKILVVAPEKRLSWQYHFRRAEIWKLIGGSASLVTSQTDDETEIKLFALNDTIKLKQGERHRLIGDKNNWGVVAEIWQHTNPNFPSNEEDIVRLQDDFGR